MDATNRNFVEVEDVAVPDLGMAEGIWYGTTRKMQIEVETVSSPKKQAHRTEAVGLSRYPPPKEGSNKFKFCLATS
jgi:hypothetical protein